MARPRTSVSQCKLNSSQESAENTDQMSKIQDTEGTKRSKETVTKSAKEEQENVSTDQVATAAADESHKTVIAERINEEKESS